MRRILILLALLCWASSVDAAQAYYNTRTVPNTQCGGGSNLSLFPHPLSFTDANLKTTGNGGHVTDAQGDDIRWYSDSALTTPIKFYREFYAPTTGQVVFYVQGTCNVTTGAVFYYGYGDAALTADASTKATFTDAGYVGVWLFPNGTSLDMHDAANSNDCATTGSPAAVAGKLDGGADLEQTVPDTLTCGTNSSLAVDTFTFSAWIKAESFVNGGTQSTDVMWSKADTITATGVAVGVRTTNADTTHDILAVAYRDSAVRGWYLCNTDLATGTFYHLAVARDKANSQLVCYLNGVADGTPATTNGTITYSSDVAKIGMQTQNQQWDGILDDVRVNTAVLSAGWILAEYNAGNAPGTFSTGGSETAVGGAGPSPGAVLLLLGAD